MVSVIAGNPGQGRLDRAQYLPGTRKPLADLARELCAGLHHLLPVLPADHKPHEPAEGREAELTPHLQLPRIELLQPPFTGHHDRRGAGPGGLDEDTAIRNGPPSPP